MPAPGAPKSPIRAPRPKASGPSIARTPVQNTPAQGRRCPTAGDSGSVPTACPRGGRAAVQRQPGGVDRAAQQGRPEHQSQGGRVGPRPGRRRRPRRPGRRAPAARASRAAPRRAAASPATPAPIRTPWPTRPPGSSASTSGPRVATTVPAPRAGTTLPTPRAAPTRLATRPFIDPPRAADQRRRRAHPARSRAVRPTGRRATRPPARTPRHPAATTDPRRPASQVAGKLDLQAARRVGRRQPHPHDRPAFQRASRRFGHVARRQPQLARQHAGRELAQHAGQRGVECITQPRPEQPRLARRGHDVRVRIDVDDVDDFLIEGRAGRYRAGRLDTHGGREGRRAADRPARRTQARARISSSAAGTSAGCAPRPRRRTIALRSAGE